MPEEPGLIPDQPHSELAGPEEPSSPMWAAEPGRHALPAVPWTRRDILWGTLWGFVLLLGMMVLFSAGLTAVRRLSGSELSPASGLITLLAELALLLPVWWFGLRKYRLPWSSAGLRDFAIARGLGLGCMFSLFAYAFTIVWSLLLSLLGLTPQPDLLPLFGGGIGGLLLALFTGGIIAPISEEVFFRGFVFGGLRRHLGFRRAMLLSAALFALAHILPTSWPPIFLLGAFFALLYEQTGSIWPAVVAHGAINCFSFLARYVIEMVNHS